MPGSLRIQVTSFVSNSVTTNMRSASERWLTWTMLARGRPSGARRREPMSRGSPIIHSAKDGDAMSPLRRMASFMRSFSG